MNWSFPSNNFGQINGISDSGIETFLGEPIKSLAREICQNSIDAIVDENEPVVIEFQKFSLNFDDIPGAKNLLEALKMGNEFWKVQKSTKPKRFYEEAIERFDNESIPMLRISDFNTKGLKGSKELYNTPWTNLIKSSGASDKAGSAGGSFGIGKFAPFACSSFRTVFYSTLDDSGNSAFQGVSRLTTFKNNDGELTQGVGYYGKAKNMPIFEQKSLQKDFKREYTHSGTDIFILGFFFEDSSWEESIIGAVLDGFLNAVYSGNLIVKVGKYEISKDSIDDLIKVFPDAFTEKAPNFYKVLISSETVWFEQDFKKMGTIKLGLLVDDSMHNKVAMVRKTGMKILDYPIRNPLVSVGGVFLILGENLNEYLRSMENPQHTKWEPKRLGTSEPRAKQDIIALRKFIMQSLNTLIQEEEEEELDSGVGEYLPLDMDKVDGDQQKSEDITGKITEIKVTEVSPRLVKKISARLGKMETEFEYTDDINGVDNVDNFVGKKEKRGKGNGKSGISRESSEGTGYGSEHDYKKGEKKPVEIKKPRIIALNKDEGRYSVSFIPERTVTNSEISLIIVGESQSNQAEIISAQLISSPTLKIEKNRIIGGALEKGKLVRLIVNIYSSDYLSMEV
ncbi:hypothetical protein [Enterococcus sp. 5H]|uniref:hypothetical protein n=1 Tax=Enterococcus sp. 5H TaxID=1229490 RepID=UPI002302FC3C|nr:hypothetical protein [Enterococcus sp. 5H]MDA9471600.1 hypothetical protein [Enterococcus sp. 5H]